MPANNDDRDRMRALRRLAQRLSAWWQRRTARRAHLYGFMAMSDRALADIGLRRADIQGALLAAMPLGQHAAAQEPPPATIRQLPRRPTLTVVSNDLSAAA